MIKTTFDIQADENDLEQTVKKEKKKKKTGFPTLVLNVQHILTLYPIYRRVSYLFYSLGSWAKLITLHRLHILNSVMLFVFVLLQLLRW